MDYPFKSEKERQKRYRDSWKNDNFREGTIHF